MDGLHPPFYTTTDVNTRKPVIWTEYGGHLVATIEHDSDGPNSDALKIARLFVAAPDMLAALKGVVAIADRKTVEFDAAHAAIRKAEG